MLLRPEDGDGKVCLSRVPEVAAYWAFIERDDDEARAAILIFDRRSLERRYKINSNPEAYWHTNTLFHDEAEEEIWDHITDIGTHLVGFVSSPKGLTASRLPADMRWRRLRKSRYRRFRKQIEARVLKLSPPNRSRSRAQSAV